MSTNAINMLPVGNGVVDERASRHTLRQDVYSPCHIKNKDKRSNGSATPLFNGHITGAPNSCYAPPTASWHWHKTVVLLKITVSLLLLTDGNRTHRWPPTRLLC